MGVSDDMSSFDDMSIEEGLLPVFGLRVFVGLDGDGRERILMDRCGTINSAQLIGILETIQHRFMYPSKGFE